MNKKYIWTEEKIDKLKQMYPVATWEEIFKYFKTDNKHVIMHKAMQLKIDRTCYNSKYFTEEQGRFITENIYTMSTKEIGKHIGKTPKQVNAFDWCINGENKVIEYFGLDKKEQYKIKMERKIALCEKYKIDLLSLYPKDIHCNNLEERILTFVKSE